LLSDSLQDLISDDMDANSKITRDTGTCLGILGILFLESWREGTGTRIMDEGKRFCNGIDSTSTLATTSTTMVCFFTLLLYLIHVD